MPGRELSAEEFPETAKDWKILVFLSGQVSLNTWDIQWSFKKVHTLEVEINTDRGKAT